MAGFWQHRHVYLTGATGFIGTALATALAEQGAGLTVLTRKRERAEHLAELGCQVVEGDVRDPDTLAMPEETDTVIHAAAWVAFGVPRQKDELFRETNVDGTRHVLQAAKDVGAAWFCHMSSVAAIGPTPAGLYTEERAVEGRYPEYLSLYEETKHAAHRHVLEHHGDLQVTLPMPGVVVGLGSDTEALLRSHLDGKLWNVRGDNPSPMVHLSDVVDGVLAAVEHGTGPYILVDQNLTIHQLLGVFQQASGVPAPSRTLPMGVLKAGAAVVQLPYHLFGKVPPFSTELVENMEVPLTYSSQRAVKELGWKPDLVGNLAEDFQALQGSGAVDGA